MRKHVLGMAMGMAMMLAAMVVGQEQAPTAAPHWGTEFGKAYEKQRVAGVELGGNIGVHWPVGGPQGSSAEEVAKKMKALGAGYSVVLIAPGENPEWLATIVKALEGQGITPVGRLVGSWDKRAAACWDVNGVHDLLVEQAKLGVRSGMKLLQVGNEPNIETTDKDSPKMCGLGRVEYLDKAAANIAEAFVRIRAALDKEEGMGPESYRLGTPPMCFGQANKGDRYEAYTFTRKIKEKMDALGVKADWAASHPYVVDDGKGGYKPTDTGESVFGLPVISTEGGPGTWNRQSLERYEGQMRASYDLSVKGIPSILWMEETTPKGWSSPMDGNGEEHNFKLGLERYREMYRWYLKTRE